ncbi:hypothetical protein [Zooshikella sp. RANM57]|uniref:hypothetical protein n=1 Tax=Zooshikella sp. RANM57 TaxID=3425863 RepID=UPI003D6F0246
MNIQDLFNMFYSVIITLAVHMIIKLHSYLFTKHSYEWLIEYYEIDEDALSEKSVKALHLIKSQGKVTRFQFEKSVGV